MNVHVPGQDIEEGVSPILRVEHIANESITQYTWFGGILGCLCLFAVLGAWATVSRIFLARTILSLTLHQYKCFVVR